MNQKVWGNVKKSLFPIEPVKLFCVHCPHPPARSAMHAIRAWILQENGKFTACWSSPDTLDRPPATHTFPTEEHARLWVYYEAEQLGVRVQWLDGGQICTDDD